LLIGDKHGPGARTAFGSGQQLRICGIAAADMIDIETPRQGPQKVTDAA
jgi:hypothetical protein